MAEVYGTVKPRKRRGRGLLMTLIVLLVIVGGALVAADRIGASYAERIIGDKVSQQLSNQKAAADEPDVTIEGIPFLTQVLDGRYKEIKILLDNFSAPAGNDKTIRMPRLDIRAKDVKAPLDTIRSGNGDIVATTVTGAGTISYAQVAELIGQRGLKISEKDGKLVGVAPLTFLGQKFNVSGTADLTVKDGVVQVRFADVTADNLPNIGPVRAFINSYVEKLALDLKVPALPLDMKVQKAVPQPDGLAVTAGASNVSLGSGGL